MSKPVAHLAHLGFLLSQQLKNRLEARATRDVQPLLRGARTHPHPQLPAPPPCAIESLPPVPAPCSITDRFQSTREVRAGLPSKLKGLRARARGF